MKYYFAYGSNLNRKQMARRCPDSVAVGKTVLDGYKLAFRRGYLTIEPENGASVQLGVYRISDADERALDRYEGYPNFYFKTIVWVHLGSRVIAGMIYVMRDGFPVIGPSETYLETCRIGFSDFGLDQEPLEDACRRAKHTTESTTKVELI